MGVGVGRRPVGSALARRLVGSAGLLDRLTGGGDRLGVDRRLRRHRLRRGGFGLPVRARERRRRVTVGVPSALAPGSTIVSIRQVAPTTSIAAWRTTSSHPPFTNDSRAPAFAKPSVRVFPSTATTWQFWVRCIQATRRRSLVASTMSGQSRRTSTRVSAPAGGRGAGSGRGDRLGLGLDGSAGLGLGGAGGATGSGRSAAGSGAAGRLGARGRAVLGGRRRGRHGRGGRAGDGEPLLEPVEAGQDAVGRVVGAGQQDPRAEQLQQQPGRGGAAHLGQPGGRDVGGPAELGGAEPGGLGDQPLALVLGDVDQAGRRGVRDGGDDHQVAQPAQQVLGEAARVLAGLDDLVDHAEHRRAVAGRERVDDLVEQGVGRVAEQPGRELVGDALRTGAAEQLVEHRQRVAGRAGARTHHQRQRRRVDRDALLLAQLGEVRREQPRRDQPERVVVGARPDRRDHLVGLGGREDEAQVRRRLLDELEQRVEALRAHHVRLVDDVDLVLAAHRREERLLAQVAGVVDTAVRGGVDLDDVDRAGPAAGQVAAALALAARVGDRRLLAVERPGQDPGRGRLAAAAGAGEQVGVVHPVVGQRGPQRLGDVVLTDDLGERLRPVAAVQREG